MTYLLNLKMNEQSYSMTYLLNLNMNDSMNYPVNSSGASRDAPFLEHPVKGPSQDALGRARHEMLQEGRDTR